MATFASCLHPTLAERLDPTGYATALSTLGTVDTYVSDELPGRNDPCHCGSGRKYKKCCQPADEEAASAERHRAASVRSFRYDEASPEVLAIKKQVDLRQRRLREYLARDFGVLINIVAPTGHGGARIWAIGNRVYTDRPPTETFHEFILSLLREELGREWAEEQRALKPAEQHYLYRCFGDYSDWTAQVSRESEPQAGGVWGGLASGSVQYLHSVAWDVALLLQATARPLPQSLLERLRNPGAYQGARYELAIAALFAKIDCEIEFLDDDQLRHRKHGEFIARHRPTGERVVVEAKSRHRAGVINEEGDFDASDPLRGDRRGLRKLVRNAMTKDSGGLPFLIFVEVNAPVEEPAPGVEPAWQREVRKMLDRMPQMTGEEPSSFEAIYATNFSPHYQGEKQARGGEWLCAPPAPRRASRPSHLVGPLNYALDRLERVPDIGPDGTVR